MKLHAVEVLERERFGDHALLRYHWTGNRPKPGQFVMARTAPAERSLDPFLSRPLFVHDYEDNVASLLFEIRGRGTALLAEDDAGLLVSAPLGRGFIVNRGGPVALVGGGVWVSPLKLLFRRLDWLGVAHDIYLEMPATAPDDYAAWISEHYAGAILVPTRGVSDASQTVLNRLGDLSRYTVIYASGPTAMLKAVQRVSANTVPAQLALRERMACANGSCYGCAVPVWKSGARTYARACIEGPVFPAEVVSLSE
ncbi:MAG: dihydroorotate dehydrogenase electron transfer subunit [Rubrobacteraceae bacterium]|nr:dihydroorotate dehydrogenase electron transfer subunit [Rubrobacteraceae bacterium]